MNSFIIFMICLLSCRAGSISKGETGETSINGHTVVIPDVPVVTTEEPNVVSSTGKPSLPPEPQSSTTDQPTTSKPTDEPTTSKPTDKPTTSKPTDKPTTPKPTDKPTTSKPTDKPTTSKPTEKPTTSKPTDKPTDKPTVKPTIVPSTEPVITTTPPSVTPSRGFDGPSFVGGIVLASGLMAIGFVAFKFYRARTELNYHTL